MASAEVTLTLARPSLARRPPSRTASLAQATVLQRSGYSAATQWARTGSRSNLGGHRSLVKMANSVSSCGKRSYLSGFVTTSLGDRALGQRLSPSPWKESPLSVAAPSGPPAHVGTSRRSIVCEASNRDYSQEAKMREEVISPFRTVRMWFYLAFMASAALGALVAGVRTLGLLAGAQGDLIVAQSLGDDLKDLGIDVGALLLLGFLYRGDARAKDLQLVKLEREESLSQLRLELASGRMLKVAQLRGACRLVIVAGPLSHVQRALALAEPLKAELLERGVLVVPYVTEEDVQYSAPKGRASAAGDFKAFVSVVEAEAAAVAKEAEASEGEKPKEEPKALDADRWLARPLYTNEWEDWLKEQLKFANVDSKTPVYLSLRLDGRVRGSGVGFPRWQVIAAQLPPLKGMWRGPFDGMDGRVL